MNKSTGLKLLATVLLSIGIAVGCAAGPSQSASKGSSEMSGASKAIAEAEAAIAEAKERDWIWRDTGKILKKAKKAAKEGKDAQAIKLANEAKSQVRLALEQYELENNMDRSAEVLGALSYR